jgi:hypothetical protein
LARDTSFESRVGLNYMLVPYIVMNWLVKSGIRGSPGIIALFLNMDVLTCRPELRLVVTVVQRALRVRHCEATARMSPALRICRPRRAALGSPGMLNGPRTAQGSAGAHHDRRGRTAAAFAGRPPLR